MGEERLKLQVERQERLTGPGSVLGIEADMEEEGRGERKRAKRGEGFAHGECVWSKVKGGQERGGSGGV